MKIPEELWVKNEALWVKNQNIKMAKRCVEYLRYQSLESIKSDADPKDALSEYQRALLNLKKYLRDGGLFIGEVALSPEEMSKFEALANSVI